MKVTIIPRMLELVIIEDQRMVRDGLLASIGAELAVNLAGAFGSAAEVLANLEVLKTADIALVDLNLGEEQAFEFLPEIRQRVPGLKLIWVTSIASEYLLSRALDAQLEGFVHKNDPTAVLITAIERVAAGDRFVSDTVKQMHVRFRQNAHHFNKLLSTREQELVTLLGQGLSNEEAAAMLGLSPSTVQTHRRNIMGRLNLHSAAELQAYALKTGFTTPGRLHTPGVAG